MGRNNNLTASNLHAENDNIKTPPWFNANQHDCAMALLYVT